MTNNFFNENEHHFACLLCDYKYNAKMQWKHLIFVFIFGDLKVSINVNLS